MAAPAFTSTANAGSYNESWRSLYDFALFPQYFSKMVDRYGDLFGFNEFLNIAGLRMTVPSNTTMKLFERDTIFRPVVIGIGGIATAAAGADITFTLDAGMYDSNNSGYLRVNDTIQIPARYLTAAITTPREYIITEDDGGVGAAKIYTAKPLKTDSEIGTLVPASTEIMYGANKAAEGTGQPAGRTKGLAEREYDISLVKESTGWDGGQFSRETWVNNGQVSGEEGGLYNQAMFDCERALDHSLNKALFLSDSNSKGVTQTTGRGFENKILSGEGMWNTLDAQGITYEYTDTIPFKAFADFRKMFQSQGVNPKVVDVFLGQDLMDSIELNSGLDFVQDFSNTDFTEAGTIEVRYKTFKVGGITYNFIPLTTFSDPTSFGASGYNDYFSTAAIMVPRVNNEVVESGSLTSVQGKAIPNMCLGDVSYGGENRTRAMATIAGMNGLGLTPVNDIDSVNFYIFKHYFFLLTQANQFIKITKA
jgi:hypothetical protein